MNFLKQIILIVVLFAVFFAPIEINTAKAQDIKFSSWIEEAGVSTRIKKIIFVPIKRNKVLSISNEKYTEEIAYFFKKLGYKAPIASFAVFSGGSFTIINPQIQNGLFESSLGTPASIVFLVYENGFSINDFSEGIKSLAAAGLTDLVANSDIKALGNFELRDIKSFQNDSKNIVEFSDPRPETEELKTFLSNIDFATKKSYELKLEALEYELSVDPNTAIEMKIVIKNSSAWNAYFSPDFKLSVRTDTDSGFYVSDIWSSTKMALSIDEGSIKTGSTKVYSSKIKSPLLPGKYKETFDFYTNENRFEQKEFEIEVKDTGQKVLRIKGAPPLGLSVRSDPNASSQELSKVANGAEFIFTAEQNGFYRIKYLADKEAWVSGRYVEVIK
jgi:hypothetical protein